MEDGTVRSAVCMFVVLAASVATVGGLPASAAPSGTHPAASADSPVAGGTPTVTMTYRLTPERPGEVTVRLAVENPGAVRGLGVPIRDRMTVVSADGFDAQRRAYVWDGETATPVLTYREEANVSFGTGDGRRFGSVDAGEWALLAGYGYTLPPVGYQGIEENRPDVTYRVDGQGVASSGVVFLGPGETFERTVEGQRMRVYVPDAARADLSAYPERILGALVDASGSLDIGHRRDSATTVAAPTTVDWTSGGRAPGFTGTFVLADRTLDGPDTTWVHEYVHLRQHTRWGPDLRWVREGSADYYAALSSYQTDRATFEEFRRFVSAERRAELLDATLADESTWESDVVEYAKGRRVSAALDAKIRRDSNGTRTLENVLWRLNHHDGEVTYADFEDAVAATTGRRYDDWLATYVKGSAVPPVPEDPATYERVPDARHRLPTTSTAAPPADPTPTASSTTGAVTPPARTSPAVAADTEASTPSTPTHRPTNDERTSVPASSGDGPGVGVPGALVALLLVAALLGRR